MLKKNLAEIDKFSGLEYRMTWSRYRLFWTMPFSRSRSLKQDSVSELMVSTTSWN